jgi:hypothetical protein
MVAIFVKKFICSLITALSQSWLWKVKNLLVSRSSTTYYYRTVDVIARRFSPIQKLYLLKYLLPFAVKYVLLYFRTTGINKKYMCPHWEKEFRYKKKSENSLTCTCRNLFTAVQSKSYKLNVIISVYFCKQLLKHMITHIIKKRTAYAKFRCYTTLTHVGEESFVHTF